MKHILTPVLAVGLACTLSMSATAMGADENGIQKMIPTETLVSVVEVAGVAKEEDPDTIHVVVNDTVIALDVPVQVWNETSYVSYWPVVKALYPDATAEWSGGRAVVNASGLTLEIWPDRTYFTANGRYLYLPTGVKLDGDILLLPIRNLCTALGADVAWDPIGNNVVVTAGNGPIASADAAYPEDVLYWLSHIINAEAGNQPLTGKIAVGNVVLNRVSSSLFPNTVYEVIHQRNQFTPVANGSIKLQPNEESIIAAKLCLDGANTVGNALYFMNPRTSSNSWMARHRSYVTTIAQHAFYA